jgi:hypothetical protein
MTKPVTVAPKLSASARTPSSEPCSPLPSIRNAMPTSNAQTLPAAVKTGLSAERVFGIVGKRRKAGRRMGRSQYVGVTL